MGDGTVAVTEGAGKLIDNEELTVNAKVVERQRVRVSGGAATELADVRSAAPAGTDNGLVTRNIPSGTQAVSAATLPLPTGASTEATLATRAADATLTGGTAKAIARGGAKGATAAADLTSTAEGVDHQALDVQVMHGGAAKDPTAVRALTAADVVTANQGGAPWSVNGLPAALGQGTAAQSTKVVLPTDASGGSQASALFIQPRQLATFTAVYRLAARPYALSNAFGAAGRKQYATIHHPATSTKTVKLKRVELALESSSVAAIVVAELIRISTAPVTGNPAITPAPQNPADAVDSVCLALPTTAATEAGSPLALQEWNLGITAAGSTGNPPPGLNWYTLWPQTQGAPEALEDKYPTIRASTLEGYAVTLDCSIAATIKGFVVVEFTEE